MWKVTLGQMVTAVQTKFYGNVTEEPFLILVQTTG